MDLSPVQDLFADRIGSWFRLSPDSADDVAAVTSVVLIILIAVIVDQAFRKLIDWLVPKVVKRLKSETPRAWESALRKQLVAKRSAHLVGTFVFYWLIQYALKDVADILGILQNAVEGYLVIVGILMINAFLRAARDVWDGTSLKVGVPIQVATQSLQILIWVVGTILAVSVTFDLTVTVLLSGLAGMTAILALVFRDSILGFVAGIQLAGNDMLQTGDWIDVPQHGASGTVEVIGLTTVKVRNFDKTISTVPTYSLVSQSFKNWRGMKEFEARRIKRSFKLDMDTVRFASENELQQTSGINTLEDFWAERNKPVVAKAETNDEGGAETLTNLSIFGDYLRYYLKQHPEICQDKLVMVRQLEPDEHGLPIEIYCFCNDIQWSHYEQVQWDIMDHVLAVLSSFGLKAFQLATSLETTAPKE